MKLTLNFNLACAVFFISVFIFVFGVNNKTYAASVTTYPGDNIDTSWKNAAAANCTANTVHGMYFNRATQSGTNVTFYIHAFSYRCANATKSATLVYNKLTSIRETSSAGLNLSQIAVPTTFYSGLTLGIGQYTSIYAYGPFTISTPGPGTYSFTINFEVGSFGTSTNTAQNGLTLTVTDLCSNIAGVQYPVPAGYTRISGNCYRAPAVTLTVSCSGGIVTVTYTASDADGDLNYVDINPGGVTPTGLRRYYSSTGTYNYTFNGSYGTTSYPVTARAYDGVGLSSSLIFRNYTCAAPPLSATCRFLTTPIIIEAGNYQPNVLVKNTSTVTGSFQPSFAISGKPTVTGPSTNIGAGLEQSIDASTTVAFSSADERRWPMTVTVTWSGGSTPCTNNIDVVRKPFFKTTNGDLLVGGKYPSGTPALCENTTNPTNINAYSWATVNSATDRKGANTEHAAKIFGTALEIYSAGTGYTAPSTELAKKWLTISNTSGEWGGSSGGIACMTDFYFDTLKTTDASTITSPYSLSTAIIPTSQQVKITGPLTLDGVTNFSNKLAVYVTGDVYISSNITLSTIYTSNNLATGSSDVNKIPFFALIVKGDIYVAPSVTQLDGMYVAQPNGASGGTIFTCGTSTFAGVAQANIYSTCGNPLTFNGIVQAKKLRLHRVSGTLSTDQPAETFNSLPELYLADTPFKDTTSDSAQYDSAATLPPLL